MPGSAGPSPQSVVRAAPAKINLWLRVLGRREDGYHLLDSLVAFVDLADRVEIAVAEHDSFTVDGRFAATLAGEADNLVLRAVRSLSLQAARSQKLAIRLHKEIPVAAGLGGGSSDAAATLLALRELWRLPSDAVDLSGIAAVLGADVPMCLAARPMLVGGVGERMRRAAGLPPCAVLLVNPGIDLATADVFRALAAARGAPPRPEDMPNLCFDDLAGLAAAMRERGNDLTAPACRLVPAIGDVLQELRRHAPVEIAAMSGSGATCFGLLRHVADASAIAADIASRFPQWFVWAGGLRS